MKINITNGLLVASLLSLSTAITLTSTTSGSVHPTSVSEGTTRHSKGSFAWPTTLRTSRVSTSQLPSVPAKPTSTTALPKPPSEHGSQGELIAVLIFSIGTLVISVGIILAVITVLIRQKYLQRHALRTAEEATSQAGPAPNQEGQNESMDTTQQGQQASNPGTQDLPRAPSPPLHPRPNLVRRTSVRTWFRNSVYGGRSLTGANQPVQDIEMDNLASNNSDNRGYQPEQYLQDFQPPQLTYGNHQQPSSSSRSSPYDVRRDPHWQDSTRADTYWHQGEVAEPAVSPAGTADTLDFIETPTTPVSPVNVLDTSKKSGNFF